MHRITFSLTFYGIVSAVITLFMLWGFFTIFNILRFEQCSSWMELPPPPYQVTTLSGTFQNRLIVETINKSVYCLKSNQWAKCILPSYSLTPDTAPDWLENSFFQKGNVLQLIRGDNPFNVVYFILLKNGQIFSCNINFNLEVNKILSSTSVVWLIIPAVIGIVSFIAFMNIFVKESSPTLWNFWGKGTKIK